MGPDAGQPTAFVGNPRQLRPLSHTAGSTAGQCRPAVPHAHAAALLLPAAAPTSSSLLSSLVRWATCESPSSASFARMSLSRRKGRSSVARKGAGRDHDHQSQQGCRHSCSPGTTCHQGSRPGCILGVPCSQETCPLNTPLPHLGLVCAGRALLHQQLATARSCLHPHRKGGRGAQQGGHVAASGAQPAAAAHAATVCTALCAGKAGRATPCCAEAGRARLAAR